jgi:hypothetical protein
MLCAALAIMLSGQSFISLMDSIEHSHHHAHFANPLAGDIEWCAGDHDVCGLHHDADDHDDGGLAADNDHAGSPAGHQHGGASIVFLAAQIFTFPVRSFEPSRCECEPGELVSFSPHGPDHPPKKIVSIYA